MGGTDVKCPAVLSSSDTDLSSRMKSMLDTYVSTDASDLITHSHLGISSTDVEKLNKDISALSTQLGKNEAAIRAAYATMLPHEDPQVLENSGEIGIMQSLLQDYEASLEWSPTCIAPEAGVQRDLTSWLRYIPVDGMTGKPVSTVSRDIDLVNKPLYASEMVAMRFLPVWLNGKCNITTPDQLVPPEGAATKCKVNEDCRATCDNKVYDLSMCNRQNGKVVLDTTCASQD